ncbi:helix-turn-helix domain-containing protein [Aquibacillus salsiterrae]|uniref:AraC family transcriptional regulator n=1 Tax=Aquibacillus salsiterrae TaxID=2950439 RepID=A0A9X3WCE2_9BACI|nr:AraC family transcriptional regulator [Aquibacillus salsiterrae]MDC3416028.1 AraC family transcriptional regulator [Aquibacillus salsiterrae]
MNSREVDLANKGIRLYESKHRDGDLIDEHHHDIHQVLYALEGEGSIYLNRKNYSFRQDNLAVITPNTSHSIISDSKLTVLVLAFDKDILEESIKQDLLDLFFKTTRFIELNPFDSSNLRQILRQMLYEQSYGDSINYVAIKIYLSELLLKLARSQEQPEIFDANVLRAERLRNYIDTHFYEMISADDLATKLGMSTRHMNTIFKDRYQVTPIQYLTEVRVGLAKKMLVETDKDIASICFEVGFESLSTFYRTFKNSTDISPNKYRNAYKEE